MVRGAHPEQPPPPQKKVPLFNQKGRNIGPPTIRKGCVNQSTGVTKPDRNKDRTGPISPPLLLSFISVFIAFQRDRSLFTGRRDLGDAAWSPRQAVLPTGVARSGQNRSRLTRWVDVFVCVCVCDCIRNRAPAEQNVGQRGGQSLGEVYWILPFLFWRVSIGRRRSPPSGAAEVSRGEPG
jgi:hypothetical protein